jgi:phage terminase small subunit
MLTERKKLFCDYYIISLNATDAARKAGYSSKSANGLKNKAYKLMKDPDIKEYIADRLKQKEDDLIVKQDDILKYLSGCVLGSEKENKIYILRSGNKGNYNDELIKKETDLQPRDRIKAAEIMAKIYKLMDKNENTEPQKVIIEYNIPLKNEDPSNE